MLAPRSPSGAPCSAISDRLHRTAMPTNVALTLVGVSRLSHPDFPIEIDLAAGEDW
jgi:hypothetical protein